MQARREIEVDATPEEVWETIATEEGRRRWLEQDAPVDIEAVQAPNRLVWWWAPEDEQLTRVEILVTETDSGSRVVVTERVPTFPLASMGGALAAAVR